MSTPAFAASSPPSTTSISLRALAFDLDRLQESFLRRGPLSDSRIGSTGGSPLRSAELGLRASALSTPVSSKQHSAAGLHNVDAGAAGLQGGAPGDQRDGVVTTVALEQPPPPGFAHWTSTLGSQPADVPGLEGTPYYASPSMMRYGHLGSPNAGEGPVELTPNAARVIAKLDALERTLVNIRESAQRHATGAAPNPSVSASTSPDRGAVPYHFPVMVDRLTDAFVQEHRRSEMALSAATEAQRAVATLERKLEAALATVARVQSPQQPGGTGHTPSSTGAQEGAPLVVENASASPAAVSRAHQHAEAQSSANTPVHRVGAEVSQPLRAPLDTPVEAVTKQAAAAPSRQVSPMGVQVRTADGVDASADGAHVVGTHAAHPPAHRPTHSTKPGAVDAERSAALVPMPPSNTVQPAAATSSATPTDDGEQKAFDAAALEPVSIIVTEPSLADALQPSPSPQATTPRPPKKSSKRQEKQPSGDLSVSVESGPHGAHADVEAGSPDVSPGHRPPSAERSMHGSAIDSQEASAGVGSEPVVDTSATAGDAEPTDGDIIDSVHALLEGIVLTKHGRKGWPHKRLFWLDVSSSELAFCWGKPEAGITNPAAEGFVIDAITAITTGQVTDILRRSGNKKSAGKYVSFHTPERTLDLECDTVETANHLRNITDYLRLHPHVLQEAIVYIVDAGIWRSPFDAEQGGAQPAGQ